MPFYFKYIMSDTPVPVFLILCGDVIDGLWTLSHILARRD